MMKLPDMAPLRCSAMPAGARSQPPLAPLAAARVRGHARGWAHPAPRRSLLRRARDRRRPRACRIAPATCFRLPAAARGQIQGRGKGLVPVEDTGRWYAGADGRPAFAHGVLRLGQTPRDLPAPVRARTDFIEAIAPDVAAAARAKRAMALMVMSVEGLERLNDDYGFDVVDQAIEEVMRRAAVVMRRRDVFARYASNRFGVALLSCAPEQVEIAADRLRAGVESAPIATPRGPVTIRVAVGAASAQHHRDRRCRMARPGEDARSAVSRRSARP